MTDAQPQKFNPTAAQQFLNEEKDRLIETNEQAAVGQEGDGTKILVACMDERNALTEEALGLDPSTTVRFASGGGRVSAGDFLQLHASVLGNDGTGTTIFLTTHEVVGSPALGCAAFECDLPEQERYFTALRQELAGKLPQARIHALSYDTATDGLRGIELDPRDENFVELVECGGHPRTERHVPEAHGGYGIYVGDFYRAWVNEYGRYFHVSAGAPSLRKDLDIALGVMLHHSTVDLSNKPIVLLLDRPTDKADTALTERHRQAATTVMDFLHSPEVAPLMESGRIRLIELETDPTALRGRILTALD